jgi:neutral ceramidase
VPVRLTVLRIGEAALCANPAERFVEFGLAIRARSPAQVTLIAGLTDGYAGYVPTRRAFARGGYETWPALSSQLAVDAGERIVAATTELLASVFAA